MRDFTERVNFLTSGASTPSSLLERRLASSDPDSEVDIASAGTREEGKRCPVQSDFSPGRSSFRDQSPSPSPPGCPTAVTSVNAPLIRLATRLGAWLQLPSPSQWLIRTVRLGYAIQFARSPPGCRGVLFTSVHSDTHAAVLRAEVAVLLAKDAIEPVPPAEMNSGFYSPYFIVPKKSGGLRPILDLRALNRSLLRLPFKMLTTKRMLTCIRHQDWFAAIDLKDAYFHVSILPRQVCFRGSSVSVQSDSIWPVPLPPCLYESHGSCFIPPLADGHSHSQLSRRLASHSSLARCVVRTQGPGAPAPQPSGPSGQPGEEQTLPSAEDLFSRCVAGLGQHDSPPHQQARAVSAELSELIQTQDSGPSQNISEAPGAYGSCSRGDAAGLASYETASALVTRSSPEMGMAPWHTPDWRFPAVSPPVQPVVRPGLFLQAGVPLGQVSRHLVVYTDASFTGWGAVCNGQAASGSWTGPRLQWRINCLELLAVLLALRRFRPMLCHKHVLVRTDSTATVAHINHQGGLRSSRMSQLARHLLLWSQTWLKSLHAVHIPGELNRAADQLSRQSTHPGEWRLHPQVVQLVWSHFAEAQIDLFASPESSHCQLFYSLSEAPFGRDALAHSWPPGPKYAFPPVSLLAQTLCKIREDEEQVLLVAPYWPTRTWFPDLISLAAAPPWKIPLRRDLLSQGMGTIWHPHPDLWNLHVWLLDGTRQTSPAFHRP
ncbi:ORF V: Enzymatic polyprotein [Labeo rohita]|uniref:ORF V: Enzymatic polyprotein n=1 Tax=Labeo rohita TaxID=84645 RepID=A0ABQ8MEZ1_LABRO|nr:ORF V: Enzymatic polyprotein [Labeo rohita]